VELLFLQNPELPMVRLIPDEFKAPDTTVYTKPRAYDELQYRLYRGELRMEFYLSLMKLFTIAGSNIFSVYAGSKITCAAVVRTHDSIFSSGQPKTFVVLDRFDLNLLSTAFLCRFRWGRSNPL
jgi:hypothetical protein